MFIKSKISDRAIDDSLITSLYIRAIRGKYILYAQIDTDRAHLPPSYSSMPIQTTDTREGARELLQAMVDRLNHAGR